MNKTILVPLMLQALLSLGATAEAAEISPAGETAEKAQYLRVNVDRISIDTDGMAQASVRLANSIDQLALAIAQLSSDSAALSPAEKEVLLSAIRSVDNASVALTELARQIPQTAQNLSDQLPAMVRDARQPIADLSSGLRAAGDSVIAITQSLPQATENARELVNSTLDSVLLRFSTYTVILIVVLALALIGVMWFVYRQYLDPLARKLDALVGAPEHFAAMAQHMQQTSDNLLSLQNRNARATDSYRLYKRRPFSAAGEN